MSFEIKNKVALISGGVSGIGFEIAKELLKNGLKGVTLADINGDIGKEALKEIQGVFGPNKAIYVKTDVTNKESYEEAFRKTIDFYQNLDILVNSAGLFDDSIWEQEIAINVNGTIHGVLLSLENYIPKYRTGDEGVILNISSVCGVTEVPSNPVYTATKFAVTGLSKAFGDKEHYKRTKVKVLALCPGLTKTPMLDDFALKSLGPIYEELNRRGLDIVNAQKPEYVASAAIEIIKNAKTGTVWVAEKEQDPYEFIWPSREAFVPK